MWRLAGTAVESFAKLADSIYFWSPGKNVDNPAAGTGESAEVDGEHAFGAEGGKGRMGGRSRRQC